MEINTLTRPSITRNKTISSNILMKDKSISKSITQSRKQPPTMINPRNERAPIHTTRVKSPTSEIAGVGIEELIDTSRIHSSRKSFSHDHVKTKKLSTGSDMSDELEHNSNNISGDPVAQWLDHNHRFQDSIPQQSNLSGDSPFNLTKAKLSNRHHHDERVLLHQSNNNDDSQNSTSSSSSSPRSPMQNVIPHPHNIREHRMNLTTGNTTDRTSNSSSEWGDDICEFDRLESRRVRVMFENIECALFDLNVHSNNGSHQQHSHSTNSVLLSVTSEGSTTPLQNTPMAAHLVRECQDWTTRFPHFRILGSRIDLGGGPSTEMNNSEIIPTNSSPRSSSSSHRSNRTPTETPVKKPKNRSYDIPHTTNEFDNTSGASQDGLSTTRSSPRAQPSGLESPDNITIEGHRVKIYKTDNDACTAECHPFEEIFVMDGIIEESIAVDERTSDEDQLEQKSVSRHRRLGYPPITPNVVLWDDVVNSLFDALWSQLCTWLRPVIKESLKHVYRFSVDANIRHRSSRHGPITGLNRPEYAENTRENSFSRNWRNQDRLLAAAAGGQNLSDLLQISTKTLQHRGSQAFPTHRPDLADEFSDAAPSVLSDIKLMSSVPTVVLNNTRASQQLSIVSAQRPGSVRHNGGGGSQLLSLRLHAQQASRLAPLHDRARTPDLLTKSLNDSGNSRGTVLRGRALRQPPRQGPPEQLQRSGTLPPLVGPSNKVLLPSMHATSPGHQASHSHIKSHNEYNRPSTTQTFRSDTPFGRRSTTPQGVVAPNRLGIHGHGLMSSAIPNSQNMTNSGGGAQNNNLLYTYLWEEENNSGSADLDHQADLEFGFTQKPNQESNSHSNNVFRPSHGASSATTAASGHNNNNNNNNNHNNSSSSTYRRIRQIHFVK